MARGKRTAVLVVLAVWTLAVVLITLGHFPQELLRRQVERRLQAALGPNSRIERLHVVPGRLSAEVSGLYLEGPNYKLTAPRARLVLTLDLLLGRSLSFQSVTLEAPRLEMWPGPEDAATPPARQPLFVRDLRVTGGIVLFRTEDQGTFRLEGLTAGGSIGQDALTLAASGGTWLRGEPMTLGPVRGTLHVSPDLFVRIDALRAQVADSTVDLSGTLGRAGDLKPDLALTADVHLGDLRAFGAPPMEGRARVEGRLTTEGDDLAIEGKVSGEDLVIAGWPVDRSTATVRSRGRTTEATVEASLLGGRARGNVGLRGEDIEADLRGEGLSLEALRRRGVELGVPLAGRVSGRLQARGPQERLRVEADLLARGVSEGRPVTARVTGAGTVGVPGRTVDVRYALTLNSDGATVLGPVRVGALRLQVRGTARGAMPPAVDGTFEGSAALASDAAQEVVPVQGRFRTARGTTTFTASGRALDGSFRTEGTYAAGRFRSLLAHGEGLEVARLRPEAAGVLAFDLRASGPPRALTGSARAEMPALEWRGAALGPLSLRADGTAGRGRITFEAPGLNATGSGRYDPQRLVATLDLSRAPLDLLARAAGLQDPLTGEATGTADVTLPFADPQAAVVVARVRSADATTPRLAVRITQPFVARLEDRRVALEGLAAAGEGFLVELTASMGLDPAAPIDGRARFDLDLARLPMREGWTMTGQAAGDVALSGSRRLPRAHGEVQVTDVVVRNPEAALLSLADGAILLDGEAATTPGLRAEVPGGFVELSGRVPLAELLPEPTARALGLFPTGPIEAQLRFNVDLGRIETRPPWTLSGRAEGDVQLIGPRARPRAWGAITLTEVAARHPHVPMLSIADARIDLAGDEAVMPGVRVSIADGVLDLEGRIPLGALLSPAGAALVGVAHGGEADLLARLSAVQVATLLEAAYPDRPSRVTALLSGEARLSGTLATWREAHGDLRLQVADVKVQDFPIEVTPLSARLASGRLEMDPLEIRAHQGVFRGGGTADLFARTLDVAGRGTLDLRTVSPFLAAAVLTGEAEVDLRVNGTLDEPRADGFAVVRDATLRLRDVRQPLTGIGGRLVLDGGGFALQGFTGQFGGGPVTLEGTGRLAGLGLADVRVAIAGQDLGLRYPVARSGRAEELFEELKARIDVDLTLTGRTGDFMLAGSIQADRSLYDADIFLEQGLLAPDVAPAADSGGGGGILHTIGLDIAVTTVNPFLVRNNLAQLEAEGTLTLRGSADEIAPFGRFQIRQGGRLFLQEREFAVQSGMLTYGGDLDPQIAITATTVIAQPEGDYEVTIVAQGPLETPHLTLSSSPALSEREIASLIATGRTDVTLNTGAWMVGEQAAALLAGRFTRRIARELLDLGLDQVDIQPELLAREGEPSARFTFGKQLGRSLRLIYSVSLSDPEAQYYQALFRFRAGLDLSAKMQRRLDGTYTYSLGQRLRFGGGAPPREAREVERTELSAVRLGGALAELPDLQRSIRAKPGDEVTYWDLLEDVDRVREDLVGRGHLEAVIDARLEGTAAVFSGEVGPRYRWRVLGMTSPPDISSAVRKALFEEEAVDRGRELLTLELRRRGYLRAVVEVSAVAEDGWRTLVFQAEPGPVLTAATRFPGATLLTSDALVKAAGGPAVLITRPQDAERGIKAAYRELHHLAAQVGPVQTAEQDGVVQIVVPIDEGPAARVTAVEYPGSTLLRDTLDLLADIEIGSTYDPAAVSAAVQRLRDQYLRKGFPAVRVLPRVEPADTDLRLVFQITEGPRLLVGEVEIVGLRRTRRSLVAGEVDLPAGEPLDPRKLASIERRLLDLGIFRRVVITHGSESPAAIRVEVEEDAAYLAAYDLRHNAEEGASALLDAERRNLLGWGIAAGARFRVGRGLREYRGSLSAPSFLWGGGDVTLSAWRLTEDVRIAFEQQDPFAPGFVRGGVRAETGFQLQQILRSFRPWELLYGYRWRRSACPTGGIPPLSARIREEEEGRRRIYDPCETPFVPLGADPFLSPARTFVVAGLDLSAVKDTRDNPLNPTRGSFMSLNVLAAPSLLGSDFDFVRELAQLSLVHDFGRGRFTWAQGYRLGLIQAFGSQRLLYEDLFRAGGPNSIRGYRIDSVAPLGNRGLPLGGEALIVLNQEFRYHHEPTGLGAAVFYDGGNVFSKVRDFDLRLLHSAGVGVRYSSPIGLLRLDLAFPLSRRPRDSAYQINFGLGQAF